MGKKAKSKGIAWANGLIQMTWIAFGAREMVVFRRQRSRPGATHVETPTLAYITKGSTAEGGKDGASVEGRRTPIRGWRLETGMGARVGIVFSSA